MHGNRFLVRGGVILLLINRRKIYIEPSYSHKHLEISVEAA